MKRKTLVIILLGPGLALSVAAPFIWPEYDWLVRLVLAGVAVVWLALLLVLRYACKKEISGGLILISVILLFSLNVHGYTAQLFRLERGSLEQLVTARYPDMVLEEAIVLRPGDLTASRVLTGADTQYGPLRTMLLALRLETAFPQERRPQRGYGDRIFLKGSWWERQPDGNRQLHTVSIELELMGDGLVAVRIGDGRSNLYTARPDEAYIAALMETAIQ